MADPAELIDELAEVAAVAFDSPYNDCREKSSQSNAAGTCLKCNSDLGEQCLEWRFK